MTDDSVVSQKKPTLRPGTLIVLALIIGTVLLAAIEFLLRGGFDF